MPPTPPYRRPGIPLPLLPQGGRGIPVLPPFILSQPLVITLLETVIAASPFMVGVTLRGVYSGSTVTPRDPLLDQTIYVGFDDNDPDGDDTTEHEHDIELSLHGFLLSKVIAASPFVVYAKLSGSRIGTVNHAASPFVITLDLNRGGTGVWVGGPVVTTTMGTFENWVKWSQIGVLDFTITKNNLAGQRPLDWNGAVWCIKWLGSKLIVYGENGISLLTPVNEAFGLHTISQQGIKGKLAVATVGTVNYHLTTDGHLVALASDSQPIDLDYSEYLSTLSASVSMNFDPYDQLLYICDGSVGFIYDPVAKSLGAGPVNITGMAYRDGSRYIAAQAAISTPAFEIVTDIYDLGSRHGKTITSIEAGVDTSVVLDVRIEYRQSKSSAFVATNWYALDGRGVKYLPCYGYEFKFHFRAASAGFFRLDYLRINGVTHDH